MTFTLLALSLLLSAGAPFRTASAAAADTKLAVTNAYFEDPDRRIVRNLLMNAGETCYFTFNVSGFKTDAKQHLELEYTIQLLDPKGQPVVEDYTDKVEATLTPMDQNWLPKLDWQRVIPSFAPAGDYILRVRVEDKLAKAVANYEATFKVRGETLVAGEKMGVQQFIFSDTENGRQKNDDVYHQGSTLWARFKLTGYKIEDKAYSVEQDLSILDASGTVLFSNPTATDKNRLFYPPKVLSTSFNLDVSKGVRPGEYTLRLIIRDKLGNQETTYDAKFHVEP
jgi:hypothetical protein